MGRLIAQSPTARVLLVGTARPEFVAPWPERFNLTAIKLARLTKRQARTVIERVAVAMEGAALSAPDDRDGARTPTLSDAMIDAIVARADGIPLYLEELTRTRYRALSGLASARGSCTRWRRIMISSPKPGRSCSLEAVDGPRRVSHQ